MVGVERKERRPSSMPEEGRSRRRWQWVSEEPKTLSMSALCGVAVELPETRGSLTMTRLHDAQTLLFLPTFWPGPYAVCFHPC
jgi:hypothetical protein